MSPLLSQLETLLRAMLVEHQKLLLAVDAHEAALRACRIDAIERATRDQEAIRQRIATLEARRKVITQQIARPDRTGTPPTLEKLAELYPNRKLVLIQIRQEMLRLTATIQQRTTLVGTIATRVLGHLNSTVKIIANAAAGPAVYNRFGSTPLPAMVSTLEAVA